jgi:hypothetical protein
MQRYLAVAASQRGSGKYRRQAVRSRYARHNPHSRNSHLKTWLSINGGLRRLTHEETYPFPAAGPLAKFVI